MERKQEPRSGNLDCPHPPTCCLQGLRSPGGRASFSRLPLTLSVCRKPEVARETSTFQFSHRLGRGFPFCVVESAADDDREMSFTGLMSLRLLKEVECKSRGEESATLWRDTGSGLGNPVPLGAPSPEVRNKCVELHMHTCHHGICFCEAEDGVCHRESRLARVNDSGTDFRFFPHPAEQN